MNKHLVFLPAAAAALVLAACDQQPANPPQPGPVKEDNECPRADGEPCR